MACTTEELGGAWIPWTVQRIANRLPGWSRARLRQDSVLQAMVNPFGMAYDTLYAREFMVRDNYFVPSVDVNGLAFAHILRLPMSFEFVLSEEEARTFYFPTVIAKVGALTIPVTPLDSWEGATAWEIAPTRLSATLTATGIKNELLAETYLDAMGDSLFDNAQLLKLRSKLWITIDGATSFGGETSDGSILQPKIVINGQPVEYDYLDERYEHLPFPTNDQLDSKNVYDGVWSIETRGINNPEETTIKVSRGFNKSSIEEPYALYVDSIGEKRMTHKIGSGLVAGTKFATLQFLVNEYPVAFQTQGFDAEEVVFEELLEDEDGFILEDSFLDIERIPFSKYLILIDQADLSIVSPRRSHPFFFLSDSDGILKQEFMDLLYRNRTPNAELLLEADRTWMNVSQEGATGMDIFTDHKGGTEVILGTRLSRYGINSSREIFVKYYDWDGVELDITTAPDQGFIMNPLTDGTPEGWRDKTLTVNPFTLEDEPCYIYILETKLAGGKIQKDSLLIHIPRAPILDKIPLPPEVAGKVVGMTYDGEGNLLVLLTDQTVYTLNLHYDFAVVDYRQNTLYFREKYDTVSVTTEEP